MTLTRTFPTDRAAGLPLADTRLLVAAMVESDTTGKPRAGVLPSHYNPLVTGTAGMAYSVAAFSAVTARAGMGAELVANDGAATVATTAAPGANSRIDVIWVRSLFTTYADGSSDPVFGVTQGAPAASPSKPTIPAGALELATAVVLSTTTQTSTAVITQTHPYTAMEGGVVALRSQAEQDAWAPADGATAYRVDTGALLTRSGGGWRVLSTQPSDRVKSWARGGDDVYGTGSFVPIGGTVFTGCAAGVWMITFTPVISTTQSNAGDTQYWAQGAPIASFPRDLTVGYRSAYSVTVPYVLAMPGNLDVQIRDYRSAGSATVFASTRITAVWVG